MKIIYIMYNFYFFYNYGRLQLSQNVVQWNLYITNSKGLWKTVRYMGSSL